MPRFINFIPLLSDITIPTNVKFRIDGNIVTVLPYKGIPAVGVRYIYINMAFVDYTTKYYFSVNLLDINKNILYSFVRLDDSIIDIDPYSEENVFLRKIEALRGQFPVHTKIEIPSITSRIN